MSIQLPVQTYPSDVGNDFIPVPNAPGYYIKLSPIDVWSIKSGTLKRLKYQKRMSNRYIKLPYGWDISVNARRRRLTKENLQIYIDSYHKLPKKKPVEYRSSLYFPGEYTVNFKIPLLESGVTDIKEYKLISNNGLDFTCIINEYCNVYNIRPEQVKVIDVDMKKGIITLGTIVSADAARQEYINKLKQQLDNICL